jgi:hypothetical protein
MPCHLEQNVWKARRVSELERVKIKSESGLKAMSWFGIVDCGRAKLDELGSQDSNIAFFGNRPGLTVTIINMQLRSPTLLPCQRAAPSGVGRSEDVNSE